VADVNIGELVATTLRNRSPITADNVSRNNAVLSRLQSKGNIRTADGGRVITQPLIYSEINNFQWYSGAEVLNTSPNDVVDAAEFAWKQAAVNVTWNGLEIRVQNAGKEQQIDLLEARMKAAEITMANQMAIAMYGAGAGKTLTGLQAAIADDPTAAGVYGGINQVTYSWWRNKTSTDIANLAASAALLESEMQDMWLECTVGNQKPDLIVADQGLYRSFWSRLSDIQRVTSSDTAVFGYSSLKFVTADVVYDGDTMTAGGLTSSASAGHMYFINTDSLFFRPHTSTNFTALDERSSLNQDASVIPMVFAGNLCCNNRRLNGVLFT